MRRGGERDRLAGAAAAEENPRAQKIERRQLLPPRPERPGAGKRRLRLEDGLAADLLDKVLGPMPGPDRGKERIGGGRHGREGKGRRSSFAPALGEPGDVFQPAGLEEGMASRQ